MHRPLVASARRTLLDAWEAIVFRDPAVRNPCPPGAGDPWRLSRDGDWAALCLHGRHYSRRPGRRRVSLILGPGEKLLLVTPDTAAAFGWRRHFSRDGQRGVCAAFFRNESRLYRSSDLICAAVAAARVRWPLERFYTYVDPTQVRSTNPGFCFKAAGWSRCGLTRRGLMIFELPAPKRSHGDTAIPSDG